MLRYLYGKYVDRLYSIVHLIAALVTADEKSKQRDVFKFFDKFIE